MLKLHIDYESYCDLDLKKVGLYRYAERAEITLCSYALDDGPVATWDLTRDAHMPADLDFYLTQADCFCAHNSQFERVMTRMAVNFSRFRAAFSLRWDDTMVRAHAHGLPGGLGILSEKVYRLKGDQVKDRDGSKLMHFFCKPQPDKKGGFFRALPKDYPTEWAAFIRYNQRDVEAERAIDKLLPTWNDTEQERTLFLLDQAINDRGFAIDLDLAKAAIAAVEKERALLNSRTHAATGGQVSAATKRDAMLKHILSVYGVALPDMQSATLMRRLQDPNLPEPVKELLRLRLQSSGTATKKYSVAQDVTSSDGRMRGNLIYCGAPRTGRWSGAGNGFQPHNLPRPTFKASEIEFGIEAIKAGCVEFCFDDVMDLCANAIRGLIVAGKGKKLSASDLASIEGRMLAWLAGEEWKLKAYRDLDNGIGHDMYKWAYARTFNVPAEEVTKDQRTLGKPIELAMGYQGGVGAFITFANVYNVDLNSMAESLEGVLPKWAENSAAEYWEIASENKNTHGLTKEVFVACDAIKRMWRAANPKIVELWKIEDAVRAVLNGTQQVVRYGRCTIDRKGSWLRIQLPSGRFLCYPGAQCTDGKISYLGIETYSKKWGRLFTYGGRLVENITQGASRDVLAQGMLAAEQAKYEVVLSVHDELITETPDSSEFSADELSRIMSIVPPWAPGLPLAAAGFESYRYRKE